MDNVVSELVRTNLVINRSQSYKDIVSVIVEQSLDISRASLASFYIFSDDGFILSYKRGKYEVPANIPIDDPFLLFMMELESSFVLNARNKEDFARVFLHEEMNSAMVLPIKAQKHLHGFLFLNSRYKDFFYRDRFFFLDSFAGLASVALDNKKIYHELKEYTKEIESLKRYQENIFSSMTNILITTDKEGHIEYYNDAAEALFLLDEQVLGQSFLEYFRKKIGKSILNAVKPSLSENQELLGIQGIYKHQGKEVDFQLNVSPLKAKNGKPRGSIFLLTDQSREKALQEKMSLVVEERRLIKNMFSRYLSQELVQDLMDKPDSVGPGGAKKQATIFFADIRGYTSFSENKDPEYIIGVLNEYFSEAVEIVIRYGGYIDKFIGDCLMAAWGVPMVNEHKDPINAVGCALEIQNLVASKKRTFFKGTAEHLKVGIGMHTGTLVAGNLGSDRRMDYSVIGDTVNIAARLEGVAKAGEIIITEYTRDFLGDNFKYQERKAVTVKGKEKPIKIFNVHGFR